MCALCRKALLCVHVSVHLVRNTYILMYGYALFVRAHVRI